MRVEGPMVTLMRNLTSCHLAMGSISCPCLAATSARASPTLGVETHSHPKQKSGHVLRGKASQVGLHFAPMLPSLVVLEPDRFHDYKLILMN